MESRFPICSRDWVVTRSTTVADTYDHFLLLQASSKSSKEDEDRQLIIHCFIYWNKLPLQYFLSVMNGNQSGEDVSLGDTSSSDDSMGMPVDGDFEIERLLRGRLLWNEHVEHFLRERNIIGEHTVWNSHPSTSCSKWFEYNMTYKLTRDISWSRFTWLGTLGMRCYRQLRLFIYRQHLTSSNQYDGAGIIPDDYETNDYRDVGFGESICK